MTKMLICYRFSPGTQRWDLPDTSVTEFICVFIIMHYGVKCRHRGLRPMPIVALLCLCFKPIISDALDKVIWINDKKKLSVMLDWMCSYASQNTVVHYNSKLSQHCLIHFAVVTHHTLFSISTIVSRTYFTSSAPVKWQTGKNATSRKIPHSD